MENRTNRVLTIIFAALLFFNVGHLLLGVASLPRFYERVTTLTIPSNQLPGAGGNVPTNESVQRSAAEHSMTLSQYAIEQFVFESAIVLLFVAVAVLIVARARWNWFAWYTAFFLVFIAEFAYYHPVYVANLLPPSVYESGALAWPLMVLYFFLFPNGKPAPRRALWVLVPFLLLHFALQASFYFLVLFPDSAAQSTIDGVSGPAQVIVLIPFFAILGCQVYRYVRVSTREEKQQTKWFLFGFVFFLTLSIVSGALGANNPYRAEIGLLIFAFVPLSVGVAILRYRLFDIDILIRRTLIYGALTVSLAFVYFGSVVLLQQLFRALTGQASEVAVIISTLVLAALFNPLRRRVQNTIDRAFFRRKYDAQKVLARFAATARDEVELEKLTGELLNVVNETMQPTNVSLWLKDPERRRSEGKS